MSIFNFGKRQRMHTHMIGHTSGKEMFQVDEYNQRKKTTIGVFLALAGFVTIFYFWIQYIPIKILIFMFLTMGGLVWYGYYNWTQQKRLREALYQ
jgi:hypothetical protein